MARAGVVGAEGVRGGRCVSGGYGEDCWRSRRPRYACGPSGEAHGAAELSGMDRVATGCAAPALPFPLPPLLV